MNDTIGFLDLNNMDIDTKIVILSGLVRSKVMVNNGRQCKAFAYISFPNRSRLF